MSIVSAEQAKFQILLGRARACLLLIMEFQLLLSTISLNTLDAGNRAVLYVKASEFSAHLEALLSAYQTSMLSHSTGSKGASASKSTKRASTAHTKGKKATVIGGGSRRSRSSQNSQPSRRGRK